MIAVSKYVVGSAVTIAGGMFNMAFTAFDRAQNLASRVIDEGQRIACNTLNRTRDYAEHPAEYGERAADNVEEVADEVSEKVASAANTAVHAMETAIEAEPDRRTYEERTKAELYELAVEREITGRSTMNKSELISALRAERS